MHSILFRRPLLCAMLAFAMTASAEEASVGATTASGATAVNPMSAPAEADAAIAQGAEAEAAAPADAATNTASAVPAMAATGGKISPPPEGKGQVVFFRSRTLAGSAVRFKVREGETELGKLSRGTYFVHVTEPGTHVYAVHSVAKDVLTMEIEQGETYYVIGTVAIGIFMGSPNLSPSDQAAFDAMSAKLKIAK